MKKHNIISKNKVSFGKQKKNIQPNEKNADEIIDYINNTFTVKKMTLDNLDYFSSIMLNNTRKNLSIHLQSNNKEVNEKKFEFVIFKIEHDDKSDIYFCEETFCDDNILVIIEKSTRYIYSDSSILQNKIYILRGVSQDDINNETVDFKSYLFFLSRAEELKK